MRIKIFRYVSVVDAFEVTPEYRVLAERLGLTEWNPVVWIGRLFRMDNDVGEHWFDNWDLRQARSQLAARHGHEPDELLIIDPDRFCDGVDGPCHPSDIRGRFWKDVLISLELEQQLIFDEARRVQARLRAGIEAGNEDLAELVIADLEDRIAAFSRAE